MSIEDLDWQDVGPPSGTVQSSCDEVNPGLCLEQMQTVLICREELQRGLQTRHGEDFPFSNSILFGYRTISREMGKWENIIYVVNELLCYA